MTQDKGTCTNTDHVSTSAAAGSQVVLFSEETPGPSHQAEAADDSEDSTTSLETVYEVDPDVPEGVIAQSQPCFKHGIHYTPQGLKVYRKRCRANARKGLVFRDSNSDSDLDEEPQPPTKRK